MKARVQLKAKTPKAVNANVKKLISKLGLKPSSAKFLDYTHRSDQFRPKYCFNNCEDEAEKTDCEVVYGWQIWEDKKNSFIEAEFHSVVRENGRLIDISPRQDNDKKVLFVPDTKRTSGRKNKNTWASWTNLKMQNGCVLEDTKEIEVVELYDNRSELKFVDV